MSELMRMDPFGELLAMQRRLDRMFGSLTPAMPGTEQYETALDMYETDNEVIAKAAVPGVPEEKVEVTVEGNILSIKADHEETKEEKDKKKVVYKSTRQTSFNYSTSLPRMVDGSRAVAEVENGVVKVTIPKAEEEKPKKILVKKK